MGPKDILDKLVSAPVARKPREYIGASSIGHECGVFHVLCLRGLPDNPIDSRVNRIFSIGHKLEEIMVKELHDALGSSFFSQDVDGNQFEFKLFGGHFEAHADGVDCDGGASIIEIKSMKDSKFEMFVDGGVKVSHPMYYDQVTALMGASGMEVADIIAINKDTAALYIERVFFDDFRYAYLLTKITNAVDNYVERVAEDETSFSCRFCNKKNACWDIEHNHEKICRHCDHAMSIVDGTWKCRKHGHMISNTHDTCGDFEVYYVNPKGSNYGSHRRREKLVRLSWEGSKRNYPRASRVCDTPQGNSGEGMSGSTDAKQDGAGDGSKND